MITIMERKYFNITGYWKDNHNEQLDAIVTNFDDFNPNDMYAEDDIFEYGWDEADIQESIKAGENTILDYVITGYTSLN